MRTTKIFLAAVVFLSSCGGPGRELTALLNSCDELGIVYQATNKSFVFKTTDAATIKNFTKLITQKNENFPDTCSTTQRLIYSSKGIVIFTAELTIKLGKGGTGCTYVTYSINSKTYKHRITYAVGMGIDEIYAHKENPEKNPWTNVDTTKFHYEDLNDN